MKTGEASKCADNGNGIGNVNGDLLLPGSPLVSSSSAPGGVHHLRTVSINAQAIERYSQRVSNDAKHLKRLRRASVDAAAIKPGNEDSRRPDDGNASEQASILARKHWGTATMVARSAVAMSRDVKMLRSMVGTKGNHSLTTEQMEAKLLDDERSRQRGVIMPDTRFKLVWDGLQVLLLLYVALLVPYRFGFSVVAVAWTRSWWFEVFVDVYFVADVILNFFFAYEDEDERKIVTDRLAIRKNYLHSWFLVDFLSILPISYAQQLSSKAVESDSNTTVAGGNTKLLKILRMVRLAKLLRLAKVQRLVKKYSEEIRGLAASAKLSGTLGAALLLAHMITCGWYLLGDTQDGWVSAKFPINATDCPPPSTDAGMVCEPGASKDLQYLYTFWWAISILIGSEMFSDIRPRNNVEVGFTLGVQLIGAIVFGVVIGTVGTLLLSSKLLEEKVDRQLAELREFMHEKQIPKQLRKRIRAFMEQLYRAKTGYDVKEVLDNLPPKLAGELLDSMYRDTIVRVPLFCDLGEGAVRDICLAMKPMTVMQGEYVYKENQLGREMYVVEQGELQLSRYGLVIGVIHKSGFFGESALQPGRRLRDRSAYALVNSTLALLTKMDCERIARDYPTMIASFERIAAKKTKMEAIRMNELLQEAAAELNVDLESSVMQHVLDTVGTLTTGQTVAEVEEKAVLLLQSHARGWLARRKQLTKKAIQRGALNARPSALSLEVDDAHELVKRPFRKARAPSKPMQLADTKRATNSMTRSIDSLSDSMDSKTKMKWFKHPRRTKSWLGTYNVEGSDGTNSIDPVTPVNTEAINQVAAKMAQSIMAVREGAQQVPSDRKIAPLDLDGDGKVDAAGYDTTGDGMIDALDTNLDGHVDVNYLQDALGGEKGQHVGDGDRAMSSVLSTQCDSRLESIESKLAQVLQAQEALLQNHDRLQHVVEEISRVLQR